jgi:hypothetical protein
MPADRTEQSIAAISTPPGSGGIGIIRISGGQALPVLQRLFQPHDRGCRFRSHQLYYGHIVEPGADRIVDEVLAVGDAEFQKKCLGKMGDVATAGRTVLFVSHNMAAVQSLCRTAFQLESGRIVRTGDSKKVVSEYLSGSGGNTSVMVWPDESAPGN